MLQPHTLNEASGDKYILQLLSSPGHAHHVQRLTALLPRVHRHTHEHGAAVQPDQAHRGAEKAPASGRAAIVYTSRAAAVAAPHAGQKGGRTVVRGGSGASGTWGSTAHLDDGRCGDAGSDGLRSDDML